MNQLDDYLSYGVLLFGIIFFVVLATKYMRYWNQLQEAISQSGMKWPPHSQKEINEKTQTEPTAGYKMMSTNMVAAARVIFTMRTENPAIQKPLRGIRRTLLAFLLFPFLLAFILVVVLAFSASA